MNRDAILITGLTPTSNLFHEENSGEEPEGIVSGKPTTQKVSPDPRVRNTAPASSETPAAPKSLASRVLQHMKDLILPLVFSFKYGHQLDEIKSHADDFFRSCCNQGNLPDINAAYNLGQKIDSTRCEIEDGKKQEYGPMFEAELKKI